MGRWLIAAAAALVGAVAAMLLLPLDRATVGATAAVIPLPPSSSGTVTPSPTRTTSPTRVPPTTTASSLTIDPDQAVLPAQVTVEGNCRREFVNLLLDGRRLTAAPTIVPDPDTGEFGPVSFTLPAVLNGVEIRPGTHRITAATCGDSVPFTVLASPASSTTPPRTTPPRTTPPAGRLLEVPDLAGLTESEAITALGDRLRLANPTGGSGTVVSQDPPAGTQVPPGSAVTIALAADAVEPGSPLPLVMAGVGVLLLAGVAGGGHEIRRRRARRWVGDHVRTEPAPGRPSVRSADRSVPGHRIRIDAHRDPGHQTLKEPDGDDD